MKRILTALSFTLLSCLTSVHAETNTNSNITAITTTPVIDQVIDELKSMYGPIPEKYLKSSDLQDRREKYRTGDSTNAVVHKVLGHDVRIVEHKLDDSQVYAVSIHCTLPDDPLPKISYEDVEKIIYGYSINDGLLIEDTRDIESIVTSIKTKSVKEFESTLFLAVSNVERSFVLSTKYMHGCTLAIRMILKNGEKTGTHGHIDERDWNPEVADLFINAIKGGRTTSLGDVDVETLIPVNETE